MGTQITEKSPSHFNPFRTWGLWAVALGAMSLVLVLYQIFAPMSEPSPSVGTQIGEIAGDMKRSAWRSFFGLSDEAAEVEPATSTLYLLYVAPVMGVAAILLSLVSGLVGENWRFAAYGTGLGATAVLFHFFWWLALLVCGVLLLIAIIENLGSFFSFGFWN
jgi:hypothetical protein